MPITHHELVLPELGLGRIPITVSVWLVEVGVEVTAGDRLLEVVAGSVTVDLPSPASGVLAKVFVDEDEPVTAGQLLAIVESPAADDAP